MNKKTFLALLIASSSLTTMSAQAGTYFKLGFSGAQHEVESGTLHSYNDGKNEAREHIEISGFGVSPTIGLGYEFNDYFSVETRYHIGLSSTSEIDTRTDRDKFENELGSSEPSVYGDFTNLEEKNRLDLLLRFSTPSLLGVQPFVNIGASTANLSVGSHKFNETGLTAGAGFNFNFNKHWTLSLEYMVYAPLEYINKTIIRDNESSEPSENIDENMSIEPGNEVGYTSTKSEWIGRKAMLSISYKF